MKIFKGQGTADLGKPWRFEEDGLTVTRGCAWSPPGCHPVGCGLQVHVEDGKVAGYASLSRYRDRKAFDPAVEISIYVHKDYRGRGIGRSLMEKVLAYAAECDEIDTVISLITSENAASIHLHEVYGFEYCGQIKNAGTKFGRKLSLNAYQILYDR